MDISYNDRYFRFALGFIAAHIIVMYNEPDNFLQALFTLSYLKGLTGSFAIAMLLIEWVHLTALRLDRRWDWHYDTLTRLFWQTILGFLIPAVLAFLMAALFFYAYGYNIFKTTYMSQDYTLILFMILAINIYYFGLNSFLRLRYSSTAKDGNVNSTTPSKEVILVDTVNRSIPVKVEDIAYYYILKGDIYMRTNAMSNMKESYPVQDNLRALEQKLDKRMFFRINRQMIVSFQSCLYYKPGKNKTLEVALTPAPYQNADSVPVEHSRLCIVSEDRAVSFRKWMDR